MRFRNKRTEEIINAYSLEIRGDKACVRFTENGKEYAWLIVKSSWTLE